MLEKLRRTGAIDAIGRGSQRRYQRASIDTFSGRMLDGENKSDWKDTERKERP
jgi:hypothetical protein